MDQRPIPAFYCCYLLRSTTRHGSLYIGSTPDPRRRLGQHNGESKGGAYRTARAKLRPWEMTCIVHGFPSSSSALQFEWAWQHPNLSKKVSSDLRQNAKISTNRPGTSLKARLSNLQLLLSTSAFERWPLTLRFFNEQVHKAWLDLCEHDRARLSPGIDAILDLQDQNGAEEETVDENDIPPSSQAHATNRRKKSRWAATGGGGVQGLDTSYAPFDTHIQKSISVLREERDSLRCGICRQGLGGDQTVVCPHAFCEHTAHLVCLASVFLGQELGQRSSALLPTKGYCPSCRGESKWGDLVKELSLRSRSQPKRGKTGETRSSGVSRAESSDGRDDDEGEISLYDLADIPEGKEAEAAAEAQARILEDDWSESELEDFIGKHVTHANHGPKGGYLLSDVVEEESDG